MDGTMQGQQSQLVRAPKLWLLKTWIGKVREYLIYLPLYDGAEKIEVGVDNDSDFNPKPENLMFSREKRVIFYGTSITQGGCASRPGMAYPSIFSRLFGGRDN